MTPYEIIYKKRNGGELSASEIKWFIASYTSGAIPDYQTSALLMAIFLKGMTPQETTELAMAMMNSGRVFDLSDIPGIKVDKHSTGGVGDKVSIILAPMVAAAGVPVPMVAGGAWATPAGRWTSWNPFPVSAPTSAMTSSATPWPGSGWP